MSPDFFHSLMSGRSRGVTASCLRGTLSVGSFGYRIAAQLRNRAFDCGWRTIRSADVPVVSVGNITAGGTGKTPVVAFLARWFVDRNIRPAILSRGYRALQSSNGTVGENDEKLLLDRLCPGVPHLQSSDRVATAKHAVDDFLAQVLILDDGFQHRRLARDIDIVLVDCLNPWGYGRLLPRGLLREPLSSLRRADLIVLTRADQCPPEAKDEIRSTLTRYRGVPDAVEVAFRPTELVGIKTEGTTFEGLRGAPILAACGIGNPQGFAQTLESIGCRIVGFERYPDHHHFTMEDCRHLADKSRALNATAIVMTEKDLVKIPVDYEFPVAVCAVRLGASISHGVELLEGKLVEIVAGKMNERN